MTSWTPARSILLSELLDDVVGTEEMVKIRQDYCRICDCLDSTADSYNDNVYFTGSKAEGLDLPGSDFDFMVDINNQANVLIIQKIQDAPTAMHKTVFCMKTENVPPCFVLLRNVNQDRSGLLLDACQLIDNAMYLSSYLLLQSTSSEGNTNAFSKKIARQGPSIERWTPYMDTSQSGIDNVPSIHCPFWPDSAKEWRTRPRQFAWPSPSDITSIVDFGFHIVPVGHPRSDTNMMEWRISFSVAERTLVWSFNHVQLQCYAVLKIILKEFITPHCRPDNRVLCSYFIKTYLFWKYEETAPSFWCPENFRECVMFLLSGFRDCIFHGSLIHYFIPGFNLFSVKLTTAARLEILRSFGVILQYDSSVMKACNTLKPVWDQFVNTHYSISHDLALRRQENLLKTDVCLMCKIQSVLHYILLLGKSTFCELVSRCFQNIQTTTSLGAFAVQILLFRSSCQIVGNSYYRASRGKKTLYRPFRYLHLNICGFDITTNRLWYAMLMTMRGDYRLSLDAIRNVLSSIPPFALYASPDDLRHVSHETKHLYVDVFSVNRKSVTERARKAWMFDIIIKPADIDTLPVAIQIELSHCDKLVGVYVSPFVCAYYLMFLNYHALNQYENRDRALRRLIEAVNNREQCGTLYHSYNIAGHCLLYMGLYEQARDMFMRSYQLTSSWPAFHRLNSARLYLQYLHVQF